MRLHDYILSIGGVDWRRGYEPWAEILPERFQLMIVSRFADAFVIAEDGAVHRLDVNLGALSRLADDREQFADLIDTHGAEWMFIPLVDACAAAGRGLLPGQCYAFTRPLAQGGAYRAENVHAADVDAHLAALGALFRRTYGVPAPET